MIYTKVIAKLCLILFSVYLFVTGILFILGPIFFDIDYDFKSNFILIEIYLLIILKLFATFWIIVTLANIKLLKYKRLSNLILGIAITCSLIHLIFVMVQNLLGNNIDYLLEIMTEDSIKTILVILLYFYLAKIEIKELQPRFRTKKY